MKEKILEFLKQQDGFISGQRICDELGVSRTAVWKYMNSLKKEGYEIESVTRKGYRLLQSPDLLTTEEILSSMKEACIPGELCCFESIDSTNEEAKRPGRKRGARWKCLCGRPADSRKGTKRKNLDISVRRRCFLYHTAAT